MNRRKPRAPYCFACRYRHWRSPTCEGVRHDPTQRPTTAREARPAARQLRLLGAHAFKGDFCLNCGGTPDDGLPTECPNNLMTPQQRRDCASGNLNFLGGRWVRNPGGR